MALISLVHINNTLEKATTVTTVTQLAYNHNHNQCERSNETYNGAAGVCEMGVET